MSSLRILMIASEAVPFAKTGGLADVIGALPRALAQLGHEVAVAFPRYRGIKAGRRVARFPVMLRTVVHEAGIYEETLDDRLRVLLVDCPAYYDRPGLYGAGNEDYADNAWRFAFLSRAALEHAARDGERPNVVHAHDWQAGLAPVYLRTLYAHHPVLAGVPTVFTIHNLAYQGLFEKEILAKVGLPESLFNMNDLEFFGKVNYLKAGVLYATAVNTVSPRYSREIQTPEFGCGLDGLLRSRSGVLSGILNGVDYADWDPSTDRLLPARFSPADMAGKAVSKAALLEMFGLPVEGNVPVAGMVTRLAGQKGLDIVCQALEGIFRLGVTVIILGTGDQKIQDFLKESQLEFPRQLGLKIAFDEKIAHTIYGGSDMFLIPSRYEPCGLTQMYALKYGTIPVVRATGGLDDSIQEFDAKALTGNGFKFTETEPEAMLGALARALDAYSRKDLWTALMRNGMSADFSWTRSAGEYLALYRDLAGRPSA